MDGTAAMAELRANDLDFDCLCDNGGAKAWLVGIMAARAAVVERSATDFILFVLMAAHTLYQLSSIPWFHASRAESA